MTQTQTLAEIWSTYQKHNVVVDDPHGGRWVLCCKSYSEQRPQFTLVGLHIKREEDFPSDQRRWRLVIASLVIASSETTFVFELHDNTLKECLGVHRTFKGAMDAMVETVTKTAPAVCRDVEGEDDHGPSMTLSYTVKPIRLKD